MIDIDKFEALANDIIESATAEEMKDWLDKYRQKQLSTRNFKPIFGSFKFDLNKSVTITSNSQDSISNRYFIAA